MRAQFIDSWTPSERAVTVEIYNRGGAPFADADAIEGVRASGPLHERRRRRRPGVLHVGERAIIRAHYEVQVACERQRCDGSLSIDGRGLSAPSPSRSPSAGLGLLVRLALMPSKGPFAITYRNLCVLPQQTDGFWSRQ